MHRVLQIAASPGILGLPSVLPTWKMVALPRLSGQGGIGNRVPGAAFVRAMHTSRLDNGDPFMRGAGGTPGGLGEFLIGLGLIVAGGYLLMNQVMVTSGGWSLYGYDAFGLSLVPFLVGLVIVFYNGKSIAGWFLVSAGILIILAGIIANLRIYFAPTSLYNTLLMLGMIAIGVGLVARSVREHDASQAPGPGTGGSP